MAAYRFRKEGAIAGSAEPSEIELADAAELRRETLRYLGEMIRDDGPRFWSERKAALIVSDVEDRILLRVDLIVTVADA